MRHFSSSRPLYLHTHASTIHPGSFLSCTRSPSTSTSSHSPLRSWPPSPLPWGSTTPYSNSPGAQTPPPSTPLSLKSTFSFFFAVSCTSLVCSCSVHPFHLARPTCSLPRSLPLHPLLPSPRFMDGVAAGKDLFNAVCLMTESAGYIILVSGSTLCVSFLGIPSLPTFHLLLPFPEHQRLLSTLVVLIPHPPSLPSSPATSPQASSSSPWRSFGPWASPPPSPS